ncbi:MAG: helix-turn-helix domain-containing protein, partial [Halomonas sp.]|nr:helix-turn-helix domain-containing protein [Halomonas sp.]
LHIMLIDEARPGNYAQPQPVVFGKIEDRLVRRAIALLEQHLGESMSMDRLAERVGTSRRHLERRFRDTLGVSPQKFARELRLRYGLWLLHYTGKSVTEIGERCGFADTAHFSRHFRTTFGMSPSDVRKRTGEIDSMPVDPHFLHIHGEALP